MEVKLRGMLNIVVFLAVLKSRMHKPVFTKGVFFLSFLKRKQQ